MLSVPPKSHAVSATLSITERAIDRPRSEEHTSELQSLAYLVCRLVLEKNNHLTAVHHLQHRATRAPIDHDVSSYESPIGGRSAHPRPRESGARALQLALPLHSLPPLAP